MRSVSELFAERGILADSRVCKDLYSGINTVKSYLKGEEGVPKLYVFRSCPNLIREFGGYSWGDGEKPVKRDDHCLDELRYYLMTKPASKPLPRTLTEIEKDKDRLAKLAMRRRKYVR